MMIECKNLFYVSNFNTIGGVETYIFELARKYNDYDIVVIYKTGSNEQIRRLKKYVRVIKWNNQKVKCKKAFFNYETDIIEKVEADEYIQLIHAMFKTQGITPRVNPKIDKYLCVSESAGKEWTELTGKEITHCRNPLQITEEEKKEVLYLVSATRLTPEKGKNRMIKLSKLLDAAGISYIWLVFTNDTKAIDNPNIIYCKPRLNIRPVLASIKGKGYGVQLSDCEGDCYFTRECEALGLPLLCTPIPSFKEQGLVDGDNCYYIPFDVEEIDNKLINKIVNKIPKYNGYIKEDRWEEMLEKGKSKYKEELKMKVKVKCIKNYFDMQLSENITTQNDPFVVDLVRAEELVAAGVCEIVERLEEPKVEAAAVIENNEAEVVADNNKKSTKSKKNKNK